MTRSTIKSDYNHKAILGFRLVSLYNISGENIKIIRCFHCSEVHLHGRIYSESINIEDSYSVNSILKNKPSKNHYLSTPATCSCSWVLIMPEVIQISPAAINIAQ